MADKAPPVSGNSLTPVSVVTSPRRSPGGSPNHRRQRSTVCNPADLAKAAELVDDNTAAISTAAQGQVVSTKPISSSAEAPKSDT